MINHVLNNNENFSIKKYTFNNAIYQIIKYNKEKLKQYEKEDYDYYKIMSKFRSKLIPNEKKKATNKISLIVHILSPSCFADL